MANEPPVDDLRALWQSHEGEGERMSAAQIRRKAEQVHNDIRRRSVVLYVSGAGNAGLALLLMWFQSELRLGLAYLVLTAAALVLFVGRRRAVQAMPVETTMAQSRVFYRRLLERERDVKRDTIRWFTIGPALNIIVLTLVYVTSPAFHGTPAEISFIVTVLAVHVIVLRQIARRLANEARAYQRELDGLDAEG